jgi:hypothetical protein
MDHFPIFLFSLISIYVFGSRSMLHTKATKFNLGMRRSNASLTLPAARTKSDFSTKTELKE